MIDELRHQHYGTPASRWMEQAANEMATDGVGLWSIIADARTGFGLEGEAIVDYVRNQISVLLARGGVPVLGGGLAGEHDWIVQRQYGTRGDEILNNIMRE